MSIEGGAHGGLSDKIVRRLRLPLIAAPMFQVSGPDLVIAACVNGVIAAFPVANARTIDELDSWLGRIRAALDRAAAENPERPVAPFCPNLIIRSDSLRDQLACVMEHRPEMVITSVGSPAAMVGPLHDIGCAVFADIATMRHAEKALAAGVDGLILLTAGAGGNTGWLNPLAFIRSVREIFQGPIVLAGGISDGAALWGARVLGCDLAYMGTRFIATHESMASPEYRAMLVESSIDDIQLTQRLTGLQTNMLRPSLLAAGLDPEWLAERARPGEADAQFSGRAVAPGPRRYRDLWSAGHSVSGVRSVGSVAALVEQTWREYQEARARTTAMLDRTI